MADDIVKQDTCAPEGGLESVNAVTINLLLSVDTEPPSEGTPSRTITVQDPSGGKPRKFYFWFKFADGTPVDSFIPVQASTEITVDVISMPGLQSAGFVNDLRPCGCVVISRKKGWVGGQVYGLPEALVPFNILFAQYNDEADFRFSFTEQRVTVETRHGVKGPHNLSIFLYGKDSKDNIVIFACDPEIDDEGQGNNP